MNETTNNLSIIFGWAGFAVFVIWILNMYFPELSMTPTEIAIKNNGKIVSTKEEVFIHRDWNYEPVKYYKHSMINLFYCNVCIKGAIGIERVVLSRTNKIIFHAMLPCAICLFPFITFFPSLTVYVDL